jgi:hypothetical protein
MYLEIDEGFLGHRKTLKVCALLKDQQAATYMLRLWTWACRCCRNGNLRGMSPEDIEIAVSYRKADGACYRAMAIAGYIDQEDGKPVEIHDWMEHTGKAIARMEQKASENRQRRADAKSRHEQTRNVPESNRNRTSTIPSAYPPRPDQSSPDQSSDPDPSLLLASGSVARVATGGPIQPDTAYNLVWAIKAAVERAQPKAGMWAPDTFAQENASRLLVGLGDAAKAMPELERKIGLFAADPEMQPWTVKKFCDKYNELGLPRKKKPGEAVQAKW